MTDSVTHVDKARYEWCQTSWSWPPTSALSGAMARTIERSMTWTS